MKNIKRYLVLLLVFVLVGCGGSAGAKKVNLDPKEFISISYLGELEGDASAIVNVEEEKVNELVSDNIEALMKSEFKDQYESFKSLGYSFKFSDAFTYRTGANQQLKNGDEIVVTFEPYGLFSDYEMSDLLSKANISMPETVSFKVEGLKPVTTINFMENIDFNKLLVFSGADGQGNISFDDSYSIGDYEVKDSTGKLYYILEHVPENRGDRRYYEVVVDNTRIGVLEPSLVVEEFNSEIVDYSTVHCGFDKNCEFEGKFSNGDKVHVDLDGVDLSNTLKSMGVIIDNSVKSYTISEFGQMTDTSSIDSSNIDDVLVNLEEYLRYFGSIDSEEQFSDRVDNVEIYKATLKPTVDKGLLDGKNCLIIFYEHHSEYEDLDEMTYFYNFYNDSNGHLRGEVGDCGVGEYDLFFGSFERAEKLEAVKEFWDLEKIY